MTGMEIVELDWRIRIGGLRCNPPFLRGGERESRHNICAKNYIKSHKPLALKLTSSRIIQVSNNLHFMKEEVLLS